MLRHYPSLDQFELTKCGPHSGTCRRELKTFLQRNQNIRKLATSGDWDWKEAVGLKLDLFAIVLDDGLESALAAGILEKLSKIDETESFFERLHIYGYDYTSECHTEHMQSISNLENLFMNFLSTGLEMTNLKEMRLFTLRHFLCDVPAQYLVENLINLERVSFGNAQLLDVQAFIRGSPKLEKLQIEFFAKNALQTGRGIDLLEWNNQREQLDQAKKMTIYVEEEVYLATKWATHNGQTDFSLVTLKRHESHDWDPAFGKDFSPKKNQYFKILSIDELL